jgi:hypothetical protein
MSRLPDFLGIGAQRAGTTWLDALLRSHPSLCLPLRRKELHYFDEHHARGPGWYAARFAHAPPGTLAGEVTPRYLFAPRAAERIAALLPEARLIAILRDPVERAYSQYALTVRDEAYAGDFRRFLAERPDALERGLYHAQLARYSARFARERLCLLVFEEAVRDPARACRTLAGFLGVEAERFRPPEAARNAGGRVRLARGYATARRVGQWLRERDWDAPVELAKELGLARLFGTRQALPPLASDLRAELRGHFAADVARLEADYGLDLEAWRSGGEPPLPRS